jgi:MFS transporter, ACS family, tartrate transporter
MILWARHSDASRERVMHVGAPLLLTAAALGICGYMDNPYVSMVALINSIGNLAGFGGPYLIGWVKEATGSTSTGLLVLAVLPLIAGILVFLGGHETKTEFAAAGQAK